MSGPLVSCIVPCFQGVRYLADALDSILAQTHRPIEPIVVDDGSTDGSAAVVRRFGAAVAYVHQPNRGAAAACNRGVALARGELIAFLEQDDLWEPDKLARQVAALAAAPDRAFCVAHARNFWVPELAAEAARHAGRRAAQPVPGYVIQTLVARREAFERVGGFDESLPYTFATDWFLRAEDLGVRGLLLDDVLTHRRLHDANTSRRNRAASHDEFLHLVKATLDRRRDRR
ncbi:MAG: glycosyltransferase [Thermoleophilia bacterium]